MRSQLALLCAVACIQVLQAAIVPFPVPQHSVDTKPLHPADSKPLPPADTKPLPPADAKQLNPVAVVVQQTEGAFFEKCPQGSNWIKFKDSCYHYNETKQYWYEAELDCRRKGGHLVSITEQSENTFVAKLTYCQSAWTGKYAVNLDRLNDPANYRWTDGSSGQYHAHNFSSIGSIHEPLISVSNLHWENRVYHTKEKYVCEVKVPSRNVTCDCPTGWKSLNGFCYLMPSVSVTYLEASFYCSGREAHMVSVHTDQELRALSLLDLDSNSCPPLTWIGLIKLNPCRIDFSTGQPICYKWADRLTDYYNGFPAWYPGHPNTGEVVNCVVLQDKALKTVECYQRHRFICKKPAARV